jgi:hypothetical protein
MYTRPDNRKTFGDNTRKAWYVGPSFNNYRTFKDTPPLIGKERMSDTVNMKHHTFMIPTLIPIDSILEAARYLDTALRKFTKEASPKEIEAIEHLQKYYSGRRITRSQ